MRDEHVQAKIKEIMGKLKDDWKDKEKRKDKYTSDRQTEREINMKTGK